MNPRISAIEQRMNRLRRQGKHHQVLFLDFDGVVNVPYEYGTPEYEEAMARGVYDFFRPEIVERLNRLIHDFNLSVVISSSWRWQGIEFCQDSLNNAGFDNVIIEGMTPVDETYPPRSEEILQYLEEHRDITGFLILDDIPMHELSDYAIETVFEDGYTVLDDKRARAILKRNEEVIPVSKETKLAVIVIAVSLAVIMAAWILCGLK